jgi:hypothetical protein
MTTWSINAAELRIPRRSRLAAHRMIVIGDARGQAVRQLNGLASWYDATAKVWRNKPIGYLPSDRLRGYDSKTHPRTFMPINGAAGPDWRLAPAIETGAMRVLADGLTAETVEQRLAPALAAIARINALSEGPEGGAGLPYPFMGFGRNSNSFFSTMLHVMGFDEPAFASPAWIVPGAHRHLLPRDVVSALRPA